MSDTVYCGGCGGEIAAGANFCKHCGASQEPFREQQPAQAAVAPPSAPPAPAATPTPDGAAAPAVPPAEPQQSPPAPPPTPEPPIAPHQPPAAEPPPQAAASQPPASSLAGARESAERVAPGANDLLDELAKHLRTPGVALAGIAALIGLGICLGTGLLLAILTPNASFLSMGGDGLLTETLAQATAFSQANMTLGGLEATVRLVPVLFVLIPILGVGLGASAVADRTAAMPSRDRFLWAAAAGIPFALAMLVIALSTGGVQHDLLDAEVEFSAGSVFLLSLLWGGIGGLLGMQYAIRQEGASTPSLLDARKARLLDAAWTALRPLGLALIVVGAVGTAIWVVQVTRDDTYSDFPPRSTAVAIGEQVAYAGDHAVNMLPLGAGANERFSGNYPAVPIDRDRYFDLSDDGSQGELPTYDIFDFSDTMSAALFIPLLVFLIGVPALLALYAGFALVRRWGETRIERAALYGASVGPLWALAMVLLAALARKNIVGDPTGDSVFVAFLLGGAVLGALGGVLAAQGSPPQPTPPPTAQS